MKRDKQSRSFREGSPLVFTGAVAYTVGNGNGNGLTQGDLVAVAVAPKGSTFGQNKNNSRRRNKGRSNKAASSPPSYAHVHLPIEDDEGVERTTMTSLLPRDNIVGSQIIGFGVYNPSSMYRVRILLHETSDPVTFAAVRNILSYSSGTTDQPAMDADATQNAMNLILRTKLKEAARSRLALNLPNSETDSFRLVNGEGDSMSGLAVDVLGSEVAVVMSSAAWCELYKDEIIKSLAEVLREVYGADSELEIVWRTTKSRLKQDGLVLPAANENFDSNDEVEDDRYVLATESMVKYRVFPWSGQKTGFYCDQRENRRNVAVLCKGKRVLDLCCYNGGFTMNAAINGATKCVGVDSSQDAIDAATENAALNGLSSDNVSFVRADIEDYMKMALDNGEKYDVIILDPPKLAPTLSALEKSSRKYHSLNRDAIKLIDKESGGLLLTCTCSSAMTQKDGGQFFLSTVKGASLAARRQLSLLRTSGAASCHAQNPAAFPAGNYLTAALFHVSPVSITSE